MVQIVEKILEPKNRMNIPVQINVCGVQHCLD